MPRPAPRRLTMADMLILVAGSAVGIAWTRKLYEDTVDSMLSITQLGWAFGAQQWCLLSIPGLTSTGLVLMACWLRSPRPPLRRLLRRPGTIAPACSALVLAVEGTILLAASALKASFDRISPTFGTVIIRPSRLAMLTYQLSEVGYAIAACWLLLLALGRWRGEPSWVDRLGRALGACWIALVVAIKFLDWLQP